MFKLHGILLCCLFVVSACKDDVPFEPKLSASQTGMQVFESGGGAGYLVICSNVEWTASSQVDWVVVNRSSGNADEEYIRVNFSVRANETHDSREGIIIVRNSEYNLSDTVYVTQAQKDAIILAKNSYDISSDGGELSFEVSSNVSYSVSTNQSWVKQNKSRALSQSTLTFDISANGELEERTATITIKSSSVTQTITIKQAAYDDSVERAALIALYKATDGDNWTNNENWCSDKPLSKWYGVTLDKNNKVSSLNLNNNQLSGSIPPELGNLSNLTTLYLHSNQLSGSIPPELGNLSKLTTLYLGNNQLSGSIPPELGNLSELRELNLYYVRANYSDRLGQLSGSIPPELGYLSKLTSLNLGNNQLSGSIPPELGNLSELRELNLKNGRNNLGEGLGQLSGSIPPELGKLSNLRSLYLQNNQLSGSIPSELANPSNLKYLYLYGNQLDGDIPAFIFELYKDLDGVDIISRLFEKNIYNSTRNNFNNISNFTLSAPEFTVKDLNGNIIKSDELYERNKVTILYWWDYLCGAAITCTKTLIGLQQMYGSEGLEILGIYDGITEQEIVDYLAKNNIPWNNIFYSSDNYVKGSTGGVPVVMVIDNNKHIIFSDYIYNRDELPAFLYEYFQE